MHGIINYFEWTGQKQSHLLCWPQKICHYSALVLFVVAVAYQPRTEFGAIINLAKQERQKDTHTHTPTPAAPNNGKQID